jgi:multiple sugar transport system permease protein
MTAAVRSAAAPPLGIRLRRAAGFSVRQALAVALVSIVVAPFLWMLVTSLTPVQDVFSWPPTFIPEHLEWGNYREAAERYDFWRCVFNSLVVAVVATISIVVVDSLAGYAFARLPFRGVGAVYGGVLVTVMIPMQITMIPLFIMFKHAPLLGGNDVFGSGGRGLVDSYAGMIVPWMASTFGTLLMREYFRMLPRDLMDAARLDGLSEFQIFFHVYLPLALPAVASVGLLTFTEVWNTFLWPLIITSSTKMRTVQVEMASIKDQYFTDWHLLMALTVMSSLPVFAVYFLGQKHFTRGIAFTGIKG